MSSPFAPTLFIGLGGSGAAVLSKLRKLIQDDDKQAPVAFRAIDFDDNGANGDGESSSLQPEEFRPFSPIPIANCIRAIRNRVQIGSDPDWKPAFEAILDWYPDPEGKSIRYAQVEAAGARQWRPLGRVGFTLHKSDIVHVIGEGMTDLYDRAEGIQSTRSKIVVYLVSSIAGGTGAGMLLDVAAAVRHEYPHVAVRAVLLLPEFFKQVDIGGKLFANAYATLWELAYVKNQHVVLPTRSLGEASPDPRMRVPPLQRVYLVGPWVGDRQPFSRMPDAYAHVAGMLKVMTAETLRGHRVSQQANTDADGGAPIDDPASRDLFCSFAGASIQLLAYKDLARIVARRLAAEAAGDEKQRELFDTLKEPLHSKTLDKIIAEIEEALKEERSRSEPNDKDAGDRLKQEKTRKERYEKIAQQIDEFFNEYWPPKPTAESLEDFISKLREFCGDGPAGNDISKEAHSIGFMKRQSTAFKKRLNEKLEPVRALQSSNPRAALEAVTTLHDRARRELDHKRLPQFDELKDFHTFLSGRWRFLNWVLALPILRWVRRFRLRSLVIDRLGKHLASEGSQLFEQAICNTAVETFAELQEKIRQELKDAGSFNARVRAETAEKTDARAGNGNSADLGPEHADVTVAIKREIDRLADEGQQHSLRAAILRAFHYGYDRRTEKDAVSELVASIEDLLVRARGISGGQAFVPPRVAYGDSSIIRVIETCTTPTFEIGRTESLMRRRSVRVSIPKSVPDRDELDKWLERICVSALRAVYQPASVTNDNRILILVEDLFHPAEEISGIYDYYADYARRKHKELFHSDRHFPDVLPRLLSSFGASETLHCGNQGCKHDISAVPREAILCPKCLRPIRQRCGNAGCPADNLGSRPDRKQFIASGRCPECQQPLRTYWWTCPHHKKRVSTDKPHCPDCVQDGRSPERRPDAYDIFTCPLCNDFRVEGDIARACRLGVNGQESAEIAKRLAAKLSGGTDCPHCGSRLIPVCPLGDTRYPHYLHRRDERSRWHCYKDPASAFRTCSVCEFAIQEGDSHCARCGTRLEECQYCTPSHHILIPRAPYGTPCPKCQLPRESPTAEPDRDVSERDRYCRNVYGCKFGRTMESARLPSVASTCPSCSWATRPSFTLPHSVSACSVCRLAFPTLAVSSASPRRDDGLCPYCGMVYASTSSLSEAERLRTARTLRILIENERDEDAARDLYQSGASGVAGLGDALRRFASLIVDAEAQRAAGTRIGRILSLFREWGADIAQSHRPLEEATARRTEPTGGMPEPDLDDLLSPERILGLGSERAIIEWVDRVFQSEVSRERFEAALGGAVSAAMDDISRKRLEHIRERARARFSELEMME